MNEWDERMENKTEKIFNKNSFISTFIRYGFVYFANDIPCGLSYIHMVLIVFIIVLSLCSIVNFAGNEIYRWKLNLMQNLNRNKYLRQTYNGKLLFNEINYKKKFEIHKTIFFVFEIHVFREFTWILLFNKHII